MSIDTLKEYLYREPFRPVVLTLPSGREIRLTNPELAMFSETGRTLIVTEGERVILVDVATAESADTTMD